MFVLIRRTRYNCSHCRRWIGTRVITSPRVGVETKACRYCNTRYRTLNLEWKNMTKQQRVSYFISEWTVGWFLFFILVGSTIEAPLLGRVAFGVLLWFACSVPFVIYKLFRVRQSIRRFRLYPHSAH